MITRILATSALAGALLLTGAAAANAVDYTGGTVSATTVAAGGSVTFTSVQTGLASGTAVTASLTCGTTVTPITGATVGSTGVISFTATVPASATGACTLNVAANDGVNTFTAAQTITIAAVPSDGGATGGGLAETGAADLTPALWFGAGAIALGAAAAGVVAVTRRNARTSA
ncbi:hypothetical protein GCM10009792_22460 [Microcella alkalica]|uniref:LPXTG-motif cell wall anchor domain-containing protein n=1 Tax=Microcella alkalica TaxID=355930 RepID=A0A839EAG9_9MICO|nr:hypothetical protein [Microcella alkalica]MBA8848163.1 hypothetical protein [Microcella alkalica]